MRIIHRAITIGLVLTVARLSTVARASEEISLRLFERVEYAEAIVIGTVADAERATVRVNETLKGSVPDTIHLVEYVDRFIRLEDRRPLVAGTQELLFLSKTSDGYAPVGHQTGRWAVRNVSASVPPVYAGRNIDDLRRVIRQLVTLQARAKAGGSIAIEAFVAGLRVSDPSARSWAAQTGFEGINDPPSSLIDAYLSAWPKGDGEDEGRFHIAQAIINWRVRRAAPMLAATLQNGDEDGRAAAARGLGGTGDLAFLPQLRTAAASDPSWKVRVSAYEGLTYLLAAESIPDLVKATTDRDDLVRRIVVTHAVEMVRRYSTDDALRSRVRNVILLMAQDPSEKVRDAVSWSLQQLDRR